MSAQQQQQQHTNTQTNKQYSGISNCLTLDLSRVHLFIHFDKIRIHKYTHTHTLFQHFTSEIIDHCRIWEKTHHMQATLGGKAVTLVMVLPFEALLDNSLPWTRSFTFSFARSHRSFSIASMKWSVSQNSKIVSKHTYTQKETIHSHSKC